MLKQHLKLKLSQRLSPQQIQLMKLIELPTQAFEEHLEQALEENPALDSGKANDGDDDEAFEFEDGNDAVSDTDGETTEEVMNIDDYLGDDDIPDYKTRANNYDNTAEEKATPYASGTSFTQYVTSQLNTYRLDREALAIAEFLVGSIDESGYLRRSLSEVVDDLAFTQSIDTTEEKVESILKIIHQLDPAGVGARSLKECLSIQLRRKKKTPARQLATSIIDDAFEAFAKRHYVKLTKAFRVSEVQLKKALSEIAHLNPKPGGAYTGSDKMVEHVTPDFTIRIIDDQLELTLNERNVPELRLSRTYSEMLKGYKASTKKTKAQKEAMLFIKQKLDAAKWFVDAVKQRQQTLFVTMHAIMNHQKEYFLSGDERSLEPMILKDIADAIAMDISTVSRVANSKYVDTPYGTKRIKDFFSESVKNDQGEDVSTREVKRVLKTIIEAEDKKHPLTDEMLAKILKGKGFPVARRTIAKYREQLDLPVARLRTEM